jgi:hypothetical protein
MSLVAALFAVPGSARAPDAYTIKFKELAAGETVQVERIDTFKTTSQIIAKGVKLVDKTETVVESTEYKETILQREGAKPPTKLEREYTKAQVTIGGMPVDLPFQGKTVVIEKKGERFVFTIKNGGPVEGAAAQSLDKEFNRTAEDRAELDKLALLPSEPVKPDAEWKLDLATILKPLEKSGELVFDRSKATGTGKLVKVYEKDKRTFGEMKFAVKIPLTAFGKDKKLNLTDGSVATFDVTMDRCIDGSANTGTVKNKSEFVAKATVPTPQGDGDFTLTVTRDEQETRKELPKK